MTVPHLLNLGIHIAAGAVGIFLGVLQLLFAKGGSRHRRVGQYFMLTALTVTATALIGTIAFRFMPLFAVLTLLTTYVAVGGWRVARTRTQGPEMVDLAWTALGVLAAVALLPLLLASPHVGNSRPVVVWSSLGALLMLLGYDWYAGSFRAAGSGSSGCRNISTRSYQHSQEWCRRLSVMSFPGGSLGHRWHRRRSGCC